MARPMPNLFLDPILFLCPSPEDNSQVWEDYVQTLTAWSEIKNSSWATLFRLDSLPPDCYLSEQHKVPLRKIDLQFQDVLKVFNSLRDKPRSIEDALNLRDTVFDGLCHEPNDHLRNRPTALIDAYYRLVVLLSLYAHIHHLPLGEQRLITRSLEDGTEVTLTVETLICDFFQTPQPPEIPGKLSASFSAYSTAQGFRHTVDPVTLWTKARNHIDLRPAIELFLAQNALEYGLTDSDVETMPWDIGSEFFTTCRKHGFLHESGKVKRLLRACGETILKQNLGAAHKFRAGKGAREPQRRRSGDKAWRRDINRTYHLHYWETSNGPEIASVVHHDNMSIPE